MSKFNVGDTVRVLKEIPFINGEIVPEGATGTVMEVGKFFANVKIDGSNRSFGDTELEMVTPAPRPPTVSDLISQLAAALGHDPETSTEAGILVDALAELARLREENEKLYTKMMDVLVLVSSRLPE